MQRFGLGLVALFGLAGSAAVAADGPARIGDVSTTFRLVGANDKIVVDRYDDPKVGGVSCYVSRAETGGIKGSIGLATDPSRFSIACRSTGTVTVPPSCPTTRSCSGPRPTGCSRKSG